MDKFLLEVAYSVKTIRYYADLGLLNSTIQRNSVGYRLFTEAGILPEMLLLM